MTARNWSRPGDFAIIAWGHDAWVAGDEPGVMIDWQGSSDYAEPCPGHAPGREALFGASGRRASEMAPFCRRGAVR